MKFTLHDTNLHADTKTSCVYTEQRPLTSTAHLHTAYTKVQSQHFQAKRAGQSVLPAGKLIQALDE